MKIQQQQQKYWQNLLVIMQHDIWKSRIEKEERHAILSLAKGLELGVVKKLPVVRNRSVLNSDRARADIISHLTQHRKQFSHQFEQAAVKNPLNTLDYCLRDPVVLSRVNDVLRTHQTSYYGFFPKPERSRECRGFPVSLNHFGKRVYQGNTQKNYMKANIDISEPEVGHINLKPQTLFQTSSKMLLSTSRLNLQRLQSERSQRYFRFTARRSSEGSVRKKENYFSSRFLQKLQY